MMRLRFILPFFILLVSCSTTNKMLQQHLQSLKGKDEIVIVVFGDAMSGGGGLSDTRTSFGAILKPMLAELFTSRISLINSSRPDKSYQFAHRRIQEDILSFRPDIVFVMLGTVDAATPRLLQSTHKKNVENFYSILKKSGVPVIVLTVPGFGDFKEKNDTGVQRFGKINQTIRDSARYYHYPLIDVARHMENLMLSNHGEYRSLYSDRFTLNTKGKKYIADYIFQRIIRILGEQSDE